MKRNAPEGFALIEALVALLVFAIAASSLAMLINGSYVRSAANKTRAHAVAIAEEEIELVRSMRYAEMVGRVGFAVREGKSYAVMTSLVRDQPGPNMTEVSVTVDWQERGSPYEYVAETVFTEVQR